MNTLYLITSILFFVWMIRNTLFWVSLWQTKEYRLDRLVTHLFETSQGKYLVYAPRNIVKILGILLYPYIILHESLLPFFGLFVCFIYLWEGVDFVAAVVKRQIKRPKLTGKALLLIFLTLFVVGLLYGLSIIQQGFLWLLILDKLLAIFIAFFVFSLAVPTMLFQDYTIDRAMKKLAKFPTITVIGVTGSYGKSSTKEYTAQILARKFAVVKTKGTNNTPIGLANTILSSINSKTEIFVAEMGAYKRGEIAQLCEIARPKIGILTAVALQHLSLFGSAENVAKAKYELIESLPHDGLGIFNASNDGAYALYKKTKKKKIAYGISEEGKEKRHIDITASAIKMEKEGIIFTVNIGGKQVQYKTALLGKHAAENILPGIYLAHTLGMSEKEIKDAVLSLQPLPNTMNIKKTIQQATIVDDTFNVNPDGIIAAMDYAALYKGKKILVLEPMIELGQAGGTEHVRVGKALAHACDYVFLTKKNFYAELLSGVTAEKGTCQVQVMSPAEIADFINSTVTKQDVIVFEGKEAAVAMHKVL